MKKERGNLYEKVHIYYIDIHYSNKCPFPNYIFAGKNGDNYGNVVGSKDETTAREDVDKFFNDGNVSIPGEEGTTQDKGIAEKPNFGGWVASTLVVIFFHWFMQQDC